MYQMTNPNDSAFPVNVTITPVSGQYSTMEIPSTGLTKREYFSAIALQAVANIDYDVICRILGTDGDPYEANKRYAWMAIEIADALLLELSKEAE